MRVLKYILLFLFLASEVACAAMWETGELTYPSGETEISAFVNTVEDTQLQVVLCTKDSADDYRFTLLLPHRVVGSSVIKVKVSTDDLLVELYGETSGNSIDFQIDESLLIDIPDSSKLILEFDKKDAEYLGIPKILNIDMKAADLTLKSVASQCTVLCLKKDFKCSAPLLSSLLWPSDNFRNSPVTSDIDSLCTQQVRPGVYKFEDSSACRLALDRFYNKYGVGPLSFIESLFNDRNSLFKKYTDSWNEAVDLSPSSLINHSVRADNKEWYLILYSLIGTHHLREYPNSFYAISNVNDDPTTLVYDIDNRYEMELLKYSSVLYRRVGSSVNAVNAVEKSIKLWADFYRQLGTILPNLRQAQAIRPIVYRTMLMRVWNLAGKPNGLTLVPENRFVQGKDGKTITGELLERKCSFFEGSNGEEFFFASEDCIRGINDYVRTSPLKTPAYSNVVDKWDDFSSKWRNSIFFNDDIDDAVGEHMHANLAITVLSLFKMYGFGDYFLLRECISSRDADICSFESSRAYSTYVKEYNYRLDSISNVSKEDAETLNQLNSLWLEYYRSLEVYLDELVAKGQIPLWRADFVKGVASVVQTNAMLNFPYSREELPDVSLKDSELSDEDIELNDSGKKLSIEEDRYSYPEDSGRNALDVDDDVDEDIIVPE